MEIKITLAMSDADRECLNNVVKALSGVKVTTSAEGEEPAKETPKKGRGKKKPELTQDQMEAAVEAMNSDEDESSIDDLSENEEVEVEEVSSDEDETDFSEDVEEEIEDDEPAKIDAKIDAKQLAQLKKALNTYAGKNGKKKAVTILNKYAKVSQDVKADDFAKIMKALKV